MKYSFLVISFFNIFSFAQVDACTSDHIITHLEENNLTPSEQLVSLEMGKCALEAGDLTRARGLLLDALQMANYHEDTAVVTLAHYHLGNVYYDLEDGLEAIYHLNKSLKDKKNLDHRQIAAANNLMGVIYLAHGENEKAIEYFNISIAIKEANIAELSEPFDYLYNNKGICFARIEEYDSAFSNHNRCLKSRFERQDSFAIGQSFYNLGALHFDLTVYDSAEHYFEKSLFMRSEASNGVLSAIVESELGLANVYIETGRYPEAEKLMNRANDEIENGHLSTEMYLRLQKAFRNLYHKTGRYEQAFSASEKYYHTRDSLFGLDKREALIRANIMQQYSEKQRQDSLLAAEQIQRAQLEEKREKELREQQAQQYVMIGWAAAIAFVLLLGILILIYRNYKSKKRSSEAILKQKNEIEHQRDIAESRRKDLEVVNAEITDSINYAKRIQNAIMPAEQYVAQALRDYFVLYLPKAIVAGDFFWVREENGLTYFAAADCTGHGVPGALVSIICSNALNRSIEEFGCVQPSEILDQSTWLLSQAFEKSDEDVRDGMDVALCAWDQQKKILHYSGANNPVYIIRNAETEPELEVYKGDRHAVGWKEEDQPFTNHSIQCKVGDLVYTFTDGFPDQFGGPKGKKFKYSQLKEHLLKIAHLSMKDQKESLIQAFEEWKGDFEQIDDVCILGFRVGP